MLNAFFKNETRLPKKLRWECFTSAFLFQNKCRYRIMETYWCCKKNSIIDNYLNPDFYPALIPCIKEQCPRCHNWEKRDLKIAR